ncbi:MAG: hypothetical protein EOO77_42785 [Oxalobacteraceae bacterium]|nr:MAG: hypothetical protein EOO77_42785 [Oxalobacteraceae bacterium]
MSDSATDPKAAISNSSAREATAYELYHRIRRSNASESAGGRRERCYEELIVPADAVIAANLASCLSKTRTNGADVFQLAQHSHAWSADAHAPTIHAYFQARAKEASSRNIKDNGLPQFNTAIDDGTVFTLKRATPEGPSRSDGEISSAEGLSTAPYEKELVNDGPRKARDTNSESDADAGLKPGRILSANSTESDAGRTGSDTSRLDGAPNIPQTFEGIERMHAEEKDLARDRTMAFGSDGQSGDLRRTRGSQTERQRTWLRWLSRGSTRK